LCLPQQQTPTYRQLQLLAIWLSNLWAVLTAKDNKSTEKKTINELYQNIFDSFEVAEKQATHFYHTCIIHFKIFFSFRIYLPLSLILTIVRIFNLKFLESSSFMI